MSSPLTPSEASVLADSAYATLGTPTPALDAARQAGGSKSLFDVKGSSVFKGKTGLGVESNFGYLAFGQTRERQGECLISVRGTSLMADWLTDARFAGVRGPNGHMVHKGFSELFTVLLPQIRTMLRNRNPSALHIVGHSLGGAAATLLADALKDHTQLYLYTFGAPRAGSLEHAAHLTAKLRPDNIFRVYHDTDPVPMVPVYPYGHCPAGSHGYLLKGTGLIISPGAHRMGLYRKNATSSWNSMQTIKHRSFSLDTVDDVLKQAGAVKGGYMSAVLMRLIVKALSMIMESAGMVLGLAALGAATIADQIAYVLAKGVVMTGAMAQLVKDLIAQIMRFIGVTVSTAVSASQSFLKWLTGKLFATLAMLAREATRGM